MGKICLSFNVDSVEELTLILMEIIQIPKLASWVGQPSPPLDPESVADAQTLTDEEYDAKHPRPDEPDDEPDDEPEATPAPPPPTLSPPAKKIRKPRAAAPPVTPPEPEPELELSPALNEREPPALDVLKSAVTDAVRLAQKNEGPKKILDLLPGFKDTTGLAFVMNAEDKHRVALYDLVLAADIPVV